MGQGPLPDAKRLPATNSVPPAWADHARSIWWGGMAHLARMQAAKPAMTPDACARTAWTVRRVENAPAGRTVSRCARCSINTVWAGSNTATDIAATQHYQPAHCLASCADSNPPPHQPPAHAGHSKPGPCVCTATWIHSVSRLLLFRL